MNSTQTDTNSAETICRLCGKTGTGMNVRNWHIMEVVHNRVSRVELLVEYENLRAWKLKEIKNLQTHICTDCGQKVLQRNLENDKKRRPFWIAGAVLTALLLLRHVYRAIIFPFLLKDIVWWIFLGIGGVVFFVFITLTKNLKPEVMTELYMDLEHQNARKPLTEALEKETGRPLQTGLYHLLNSLSGPGNSLYLLSDKENAQMLESERVFHGWSVVSRVINTPMPQSAPVSPEVVLKSFGRADEQQEKKK